MTRRRYFTRAEALRALQVTAAQLDKFLERGAPPPKPGKRGSRRYDVAAIQAWREERAARIQPNLDLAEERAKLARVQRHLTTVRLREAKAQLVQAAAVEGVLRSIIVATKTQLLAVPRRAVLEGLPRRHERLVRRLVTEALRELSEAQTLAALRKLGRAPK